MQKLFGYIGLFTLVALWWLGKSSGNFVFTRYYIHLNRSIRNLFCFLFMDVTVVLSIFTQLSGYESI